MALFVALGGTAYTVSGTDIVDGEVKSVDIGNGSSGIADLEYCLVRAADVLDAVHEIGTGVEVGCEQQMVAFCVNTRDELLLAYRPPDHSVEPARDRRPIAKAAR